jgi:hypothetical protein
MYFLILFKSEKCIFLMRPYLYMGICFDKICVPINVNSYNGIEILFTNNWTVDEFILAIQWLYFSNNVNHRY